jgi:hypothetical protein
MREELPIACRLDAGALANRIADISDLGRSSLIDVEQGVRHAVLRFVRRDRTEERLAAIVAAEGDCCGFLSLRIRDEAGALQLSIEAPEGAESILEGMVAAFRGEGTLSGQTS